MHRSFKRVALFVFISGLALFLLIQVVPYGKDHTNPPVISEPNWDSQQTRDFAKRACFDCHSNETEWPWYSNIAPASWLIYYDAVTARDEFNFSDWENDPMDDAEEFAEVISEGEMPPLRYLLFHAEARLTDTEQIQLITGLANTVGR